MTNADRIRGMTDEELAEFLYDSGFCAPEYIGCIHDDDTGCAECTAEWLKSGAGAE